MAKNRFKILIVEDESHIRTFVRAMLEAEDYQVLCAADCASGLSMFTSHCPDLVILDLGLPDQDGMNFITFARQLSQTPILVLSARTTDDDKVTALDLGANDYVTKPFSTAELLARVRCGAEAPPGGSRPSPTKVCISSPVGLHINLYLLFGRNFT